MIKPIFPSEAEIQSVVSPVNEKLSIKAVNMQKNFHLKEGFTECLNKLNDRLLNSDNPYFKGETEEEWVSSDAVYREQLKSISRLKTVAGRGIAILCVDWLNGNTKAISFLEVKMKTR